MMRFLTIFATVFCGGTGYVGADYFVEFDFPTRNSWGQTVMTNYLYQCKGLPEGYHAFTATKSLCIPVNNFNEKVTIHATCTFYSVYRPDLQDHMVYLMDRGLMSNQLVWMLGYSNDDIDHPNIAAPKPEDVASFRQKLTQLGDDIVRRDLLDGLAFYFAQSNLINFSRNQVNANAYITKFETFLSKIIHTFNHMNQVTDPVATVTLLAKLGAAMKLALQKMIDPCSVLKATFLQRDGPYYCGVYCNFLNVAARHFGTPCSRCSVLQGGRCESVVCKCTRVITHPFEGCANMKSTMQQCTNVLRAEVKKLDMDD